MTGKLVRLLTEKFSSSLSAFNSNDHKLIRVFNASFVSFIIAQSVSVCVPKRYWKLAVWQ